MATNATDQIGSGTVTGLMQFLDYLVDKGYAPPGTVRPWRFAARKVFEEMEGADYGETSILQIDVDEYMGRFANKKRGEYKAASLNAYRNRVKRALAAYRGYLTEGNEWKPPSFGAGAGAKRPPLAEKAQAEKQRPVPPSSDRASEPPPAVDAQPLPMPSTPNTLLDFPFPLSTGDLAHLRLPRGLTPRDADRIAAFVKTLAFEPASDSHG